MIKTELAAHTIRQLKTAQDKMHNAIDAALISLVLDGAGSDEICIVHFTALGQTAITHKGIETHRFTHPRITPVQQQCNGWLG